MKLIFDTHAAIWWLTGDPRLSRTTHRAIVDPSNQVFVSAVIPWEIAIKRALGKLEVPGDVVAALLSAGAHPLPIDLDHAAAVERLATHHGDPFDRLLIVQAQAIGASLVTRDAAFANYGVPIVW